MNNHPLYPNANIQLVDTMFGMQSEQGAATGTTLQYAYTEVGQAGGLDMAGGQPVLIYQEHQPQPISYKMPQMEPQQTTQPMSSEQQQHKKKDIVAEATSKIFEDIGGKQQSVPVSQSATPTAAPLPTAVKSKPTPGTSARVVTPAVTAAKATPKSSPAARAKDLGGSAGKSRGGGWQMERQQILPRLQLLEDEDDGLTCRMCLQSFWYKSQLKDHLKSMHSISDPDRYEREEREKKMRRIREEQQRQILAKRQRMAQGRGGGKAGLYGGRAAAAGRHSSASKQPAGPRPSFQYKDGAFICDLCKKSFSNGNDMVTHWKSHVKKQRLPGGGGPGRRGRPPKSGPIKGGGRSDKGRPRWTAYLVWSTRRRREICEDEPDWSFAEVAKNISNEWKEVSQEDKDKYQEEAEKMNASGQRKMPRPREYGSSDWSSDEDPDFDEYDVKPIMLKIKREDGTEEESYGGAPRSTRKRKCPSFFQDFENEENKLDKILDEFEQEQMEEAQKPKPEKKTPVPREPGSQPRRRRKRERTPEEPDEPVELEKTRSGRIRKKTKFANYFDSDEEEEKEEEEDDGEDEEDRDEYQPEDESEESEPEVEEGESEVEEEDIEELKKVGTGEGTSGVKKESSSSSDVPPKSIMTDAEIEEATLKAMSKAKPGEEEEEDEDEEEEGDEEEKEEKGEKSKGTHGDDMVGSNSMEEEALESIVTEEEVVAAAVEVADEEEAVADHVVASLDQSSSNVEEDSDGKDKDDVCEASTIITEESA